MSFRDPSTPVVHIQRDVTQEPFALDQTCAYLRAGPAYDSQHADSLCPVAEHAGNFIDRRNHSVSHFMTLLQSTYDGQSLVLDKRHVDLIDAGVALRLS